MEVSLGANGFERSHTFWWELRKMSGVKRSSCGGMIVAHHGEHESLEIGSLLLRLLPAKTQRACKPSVSLYLQVLVNGPIPHGSAPNPLVILW